MVVTGGVDLVTCAEIQGHADIKMTMLYAHPTPENMQSAGVIFVFSAISYIPDIQTRWTQNPVLGDQSVGSTPSSGTMFPLVFPKFSHKTASILIPFFQRESTDFGTYLSRG
jgi:hypothetical protein